MSARARARRWAGLLDAFPDLPEMRVLDLGGTWSSWAAAPARPAELVLVNVTPDPDAPGWVSQVVGDACELAPRALGRADLVYSNSVIEHLGGPARRAAFAERVHAAAPRHWVQTPYRYFPIEPHWLFPGFQFLPLAARVAITRRWRHGHRHNPDHGVAVASALSVDLLSRTELRALFPEAELRAERVAGLVKSIVAVRGAAPLAHRHGGTPPNGVCRIPRG